MKHSSRVNLAMVLGLYLGVEADALATPVKAITFFDQVYDRDTVLQASHCLFLKGGQIRVTNGVRLSIQCEEIVIDGEATIDGTGNEGGAGSAGVPNGGEWKSTDHCFRDQGHNDYVGAGGSPGDLGGAGHAGGPGFKGATLLVSYRTLGANSKIEDLHTIVSGGPGGHGGTGGVGRLLHCGCHPNESRYAPSGPTGATGPIGEPGKASIVQNPSLKF